MTTTGLILHFNASPTDNPGGAGDQAYSRLSTIHGHITDCKLDSVMYAGVWAVI